MLSSLLMDEAKAQLNTTSEWSKGLVSEIAWEVFGEFVKVLEFL